MVKELEELPEKLFTDANVLLKFLREHSARFQGMFSITPCGAGGESFVLRGDEPGKNVVIKLPLDQKNLASSMEEFHVIQAVSDHLGYQACVVEPLEELIIC